MTSDRTPTPKPSSNPKRASTVPGQESSSSTRRPSPNDNADGPTRRQVFSASLGALAVGLVRLPATSRPSHTQPWPKGLLGFEPLAPAAQDTVLVARGYDAKVFLAWGDPLAENGPAWWPGNTAAEQEQQAGMHHDGMVFFADKNDDGTERSDRGVLAINHEYVDLGLLYENGIASHSADNMRKAQAAVGVSLVNIHRDAKMNWHKGGGFKVDGDTEIEIGGPARGHKMMRTSGEAFTQGEHEGISTHGTFANCSSGFTPWGTYLTCEENFQSYFKRVGDDKSPEEVAYGLGNKYGIPPGFQTRYGWDKYDSRYDADLLGSRNHANRFGWVVEIDPRHPDKPPVKRTALGRFRHENAGVVIAKDGRVVIYMGDDERFQFIYKFVSAKPWNPDDPAANWGLLDEGTLYVAKFEDKVAEDGKGNAQWLPLTPKNPVLRKRFGDDPGAIAIYAREAARLVGATQMDRPEWLVAPLHQGIGEPVGEVYCSLSNNNKRRTEQEHAANPRANNMFGHIIRWTEQGGDAAAEMFTWEVFLKGGNRTHPEIEHRGDVLTGEPRQDFGSPDGLFLDRRGVLWVQTDVSSSTINSGAYAGMGHNQLMAVDPNTKEVRRFLTGPRGCEVTGITQTRDGRTLFINIQHPGERPDDTPSIPGEPLSTWPKNEHGRPRSATLVIQRQDPGDERAIGE